MELGLELGLVLGLGPALVRVSASMMAGRRAVRPSKAAMSTPLASVTAQTWPAKVG